MDHKYLTVTQVNSYIKNLFSMDFVLKNLWVMGEVSNCKFHSSGHIYFTLKDNTASVSCVMFKGYRNEISKPLKDGMKIIANGGISVYEKSGQYQLYVREYTDTGVGQLYKKFEELKEELSGRGWFDQSVKKQIPYYPKKIGIVTSETGAAIQDIQNIAKRRNPYIQLVLYPSLVQGDDAKYSIVKGIRTLDKMDDVEVIIVGRGGGSIEDLWPFNEEIVAQAIYEAKTPIISAVGHEIDFTIADFVSDLRAPTPSAAAELSITSYNEIIENIDAWKNKLEFLTKMMLQDKKRLIELYEARFEKYHPRNSINQMYLYLNELQDRMETSISGRTKDMRNKTLLLQEALKRVSPIQKLKDGFAFVSNEKDMQIRSIKDLKQEEIINIQLFDGRAKVKVIKIVEGSNLDG